MPAVECSDLVVRYGETIAVSGASFSADLGEVVAMLGPNGAGKTSTVEALEGYRAPNAGTARVLGLDPVAQHRALVGRIGVMLQRGGVYPMLGPRRVLELFAAFYPDPEPIDALLSLVGLRSVEQTPYRHLSGGEQQRLSLALALVGRPEVVFLDEPTSGVDPEGRVGLRTVISDLKERGRCVLLTTHELTEAERMADRVVVMNAGRVVAYGSTAELAALHSGEATVRFTSRPDLDTESLGGALGARVVAGGGGAYRIERAPSPTLTTALVGWLAERDAPLVELRTVASLEETYLALVGPETPGSDPTPTSRRPRARRSR